MATDSWELQGIILFRNLINDMVEPYTYDDSRLSKLLLSSAFLNVQQLDFTNTYTVNLITEEIDPDPPEASFITLMVLKAVAMLAESEWKTESRKGLIVKDGPSSIDATELVKAKKDYAAQMKTQFDKAVLLHKTGNYNVGIAIVGPGRFDLTTSISDRFY